MMSMIQIHQKTKKALERAKEKNTESYEEVIKKILYEMEQQKRKQEQLLIECYKEMAVDSLRITKEWEATDAMLDR